jgi:alcohol dehydrogenase YqhD (iron-dependent ADH family)
MCRWEDAIKFAREKDFTHFLAVGGGSVIDTCVSLTGCEVAIDAT